MIRPYVPVPTPAPREETFGYWLVTALVALVGAGAWWVLLVVSIGG